MTIYRQQVAAQQIRQAQLENQAREARSVHTIESTGVGEVIEPVALTFPNPFVFKPSVAYGPEIVILPDQDLWGLPRIGGSVLEWELNDRGFYTGAFICITVDLSPAEGVTPEAQPDLKIEHHFRFSGLSYKTLGEDVIAALQESDIPPRTVNL